MSHLFAPRMETLFGIEIMVTNLLPIVPSDGEDARRIVRQGLADVIRWCLPREEVGMKPGEITHAFYVPKDRLVFISKDFRERLQHSLDADAPDIGDDMRNIWNQRNRALMNGEWPL